jgi:hypothetical protein
MSKPLTKHSTDYSDAESFSFGFSCDICGKEWKSPVVPFGTDFTTIELEEGRQMIWAQEHRAAFEQANLEAHLEFNLCPICGKRVCGSCFCFEKKNIDVCNECGSNEQ